MQSVATIPILHKVNTKATENCGPFFVCISQRDNISYNDLNYCVRRMYNVLEVKPNGKHLNLVHKY